MSLSYITGNGIFQAAGSTTVATATSINVVAGDTVYVAVRTSSTYSLTTGVADTAGNTYKWTGTAIAFTAGRLEVWYITNALPHATNIITATFNASEPFTGICVAQFRGVATISPIDASVFTQNIASTANITSPAFSTAVANSILVACSQINIGGSAWTADAGNGWAQAAQDASNVIFIQYKIVSALQTGVTVTSFNAATNDKCIIVTSVHEELSGGGGASVSSSVLKGSRVIPYSSNYY